MTKSIIHPETKKKVFFGRNKPKAHFPRLSLKNYLAKSLPNPPVLWTWGRLAISSLLQMFLNDTEGDCVIACMGHVSGVMTGNSGAPIFIPTDDQINTLYSAIGGYDPSQTQPDGTNPTDNGCDIQTALNYWGTKGLLPNQGAHKIQSYLAIDPNNVIEIMTALFLFENLIFGLDLPDAWISPFPSASGFTWSPSGEPDSSNGHCIAGFGYNSKGVLISTWAMEGLITYAAIAQYCSSSNQGELYTVISEDTLIKATSRAPNGFDWTQLLADFQAIKA